MTALRGATARREVARAERAQRPLRRVLGQVTETSGITASGLILAGVAAAAWALGYWVAGKPMYLLCYGALAVLVLMWSVGRRPLPLTGERSDLRARLRQGETVTVEVTLKANRRLSNIILEEQVPALLGPPVRVPIGVIESGEGVTQPYELTAWRRGTYQLGPLVARWGDPFGLSERRLTLAEPYELIVHPVVEPITDRPLTRLWEDPPQRPPVSRPWPIGLEFYGMRDYQRGDDPRRIVWRAYARTRRVLVREAEQGITDKVVIVLDQDERTHSKGIVSDSFEAGVRAAASLGVHHLHEGFSVTLEGTNGKLCGPLRVGRARIELLDALARAERERGDLSATLGRLAATIPPDAHVAVITPLLDAKAAASLKLMTSRGRSVIVAALMWTPDAVDTLGTASTLGVTVVEIGPNTPLTRAFAHGVGAGGSTRR
jgi:uncharacterized protein (DUF58 family)